MENPKTSSPDRLTQYARGAGCGCKIAPKILDDILQTNVAFSSNPKLLVGYEKNDDAAVYDIGQGKAIISSTDFFTPIVDDAFDFGRIAAANAISDVYAMGGQPLMAVAILGWQIEKISTELAQKVIEGGRKICAEAGIPLAGGHSIDSEEPIFGLAVTGEVRIDNLKKNHTATPGDFIFLTKPLGVGILSTAQKRGLLLEEYLSAMIQQMTTLNTIGMALGKIPGVSAMTDVTGFGFLGHLIEMVEGSGLSAAIYYDKIPVADGVKTYIAKRIFPDATSRNWNAYSDKVEFAKGVNVMEAFSLLPDPQTNGGLLVSVKKEAVEEVITLLQSAGLSAFAEPVGMMQEPGVKSIFVK